MMPGMYSAISGLEAHQQMLNVTANNLANVDTIGYKAQRTTFDSELSMLISGGSGQTASNGGTNPEQVGLGVTVGSIDQIMSAGSFQNTGNALDVGLQGDGFLVVGTSTASPTAPTAGTYQPPLAAGNAAVAINANSTGAGVTATGLPTAISYTRAGNLTTDAQGFLTNAAGQYVIGYATPQGAAQANAPGSTAAQTATGSTYIYIPPGSTNVSIGPSGAVNYTDNNPADTNYGQTCTAGYLAVASFPNEAGLTREAGHLLVGVAQLRQRQLRHSGQRRVRQHAVDLRRARAVERRHGDRVHEHDRGRAWLPGQLERHQHRRPDDADADPDGRRLSLRTETADYVGAASSIRRRPLS